MIRPRRSLLFMPGSNARALEKARNLAADGIILDLEDSVAPLAKDDARKNVVDVLNTGDWTGKVRVVRVNDLTTKWTYRDVISIVEGAGANLDCVMLPKVQTAEQVVWLDSAILHESTYRTAPAASGVPIGTGVAHIELRWSAITSDDHSPAHGPPKRTSLYRSKNTTSYQRIGSNPANVARVWPWWKTPG